MVAAERCVTTTIPENLKHILEPTYPYVFKSKKAEEQTGSYDNILTQTLDYQCKIAIYKVIFDIVTVQRV